MSAHLLSFGAVHGPLTKDYIATAGSALSDPAKDWATSPGRDPPQRARDYARNARRCCNASSH